MKRYFAAAGALLLSTSTVALAADVKMSAIGDSDAKIAADTKMKTDLAAAGTGWNKSLIAAKSDFGTATGAKLGLASLENDLAKMSSAETGGKLWTASGAASKFQAGWSDSGTKFASLDSGAKFASLDSDGKFASAGSDTKFASIDAGDSKFATASAEPGKIQLASSGKDQAHIGMGGPIEANSASAILTPQPATQNYPACEPGPGDDRCIQLYERGVREQLASWNRPTGGLLDRSSATAMGGPFEPVADQSMKPAATAEAGASAQTSVSKPIAGDSTATADMSATKPAGEATSAASGTSTAKPTATSAAAPTGTWVPVYAESELAMNGDGATDASIGETNDTALASADTSIGSTDVAGHAEFSGVGGPVEAQSGYPPCSNPGPGEDRCIQLYEAGVTGAGN